MQKNLHKRRTTFIAFLVYTNKIKRPLGTIRNIHNLRAHGVLYPLKSTRTIKRTDAIGYILLYKWKFTGRKKREYLNAEITLTANAYVAGRFQPRFIAYIFLRLSSFLNYSKDSLGERIRP